MSNSESSVKKDSSDQEDPLIEVPALSGNELVKKSQLSKMDIRGLVVRCTICLHQINHHDPLKLKKHIKLGVLVCSDCYEFYGSSEFSQDESGNYNYCAWCGNGGKLFCCDFCPNTFCSTCIRRNVGRAAVTEMSKEGWKCYCCDPSKLKTKVAFCNLIIKYSKNARKFQEKKTSTASELVNIGITNCPEAQTYLLSAFDAVNESCSSFHKRVDKLKTIGLSQSKSLKHIIAKFEEIVSTHRQELNHKIKSLSRQYLAYVEKHKQVHEKSIKSQNGNGTEETENPSETQNEVTEEMENLSETKDKVTEEKENASETSDEIKEGETKCKLGVNGNDEGGSPNAHEKNNVEMINLEDDESEVKPTPDGAAELKSDVAESKIEDDNYKAKLLLLNQEESSMSEIDDILADDPLLGDSDVKITKKEKQETKKKVSGNTAKGRKEDKKERVSKDSDSDIAELFSSKKDETKKVTVNRKLDFNSLDDSSASSHPEDSESSIYLSSGGDINKKEEEKGKKKMSKNSRTRKVVTLDDAKLKMKTSVVLKRCDHLFPNGETTIPLPSEIILEELDKEVKSLLKDPIKREKKISTEPKKNKEPKPKAMKKHEGPKKKVSSSSSSICFSSSDEEEGTKKRFKAIGDDPNALAKKKILSSVSDESSFTSTSEEEEEPKKKSKNKKAQSGSSDDFQPKKKKKFDKLLHKRICSDDSDFEGEKKSGDRKKQNKRKKLPSDDSKSGSRTNSDETSSDSEEEKQKKKKKRKRIKKAAASSSDEDDKKDKDEEAGNTPGKGRKNIKKVMSKKDLAEETKVAQKDEIDRRRRVQERQKMYNVITDTASDGTEVITRKMVLEVDPVSKEEIVEIHPELVEKLKPHQVNGVKFMWECTIESLKQLEKSVGSGCILAHCMGLGKTLQVITFLHTCLTNPHVNKHIRTAMVICPYNTVLNWSKELDHWLNQIEGDVLVHELTLAKDIYTRVDVLEYWQREGGVLIVSYDLFRRLAVAKIKGLKGKSKNVVMKSLVDPGPDIVVCDEGHILKNVSSAISKACSKIKTERRIVLTGTPLQNNLLEYHCMLSFVKPHLLGTPKEFRNRFVNPIMNGQYDDSTDYDVKRMKKRIHILHKLLGGCVQRCDYGALTKFLPPKHEFVISVKLCETQIKMYRMYLENQSNARKQEKIQGSTLFSDYNILRNLCTHPYIVKTSHERLELRKWLKGEEEEEEAFINDESGETSANSSNSDDEVVRKYKTRSRQDGSGSDIEEESQGPPIEKTWFDDFISNEDKNKVELSGKMILLFEILKECEAIGDKLIVFSQSLLTFDLIEELLEHLDGMPLTKEEESRDIRFTWKKNIDYFRMDGSTSAEFRKQYIDYFNDPAHDRARLFLVSTKAGGLGTNLVGANRVIMLDASWNPSHDVQAIFRVYRFGQKKPVYIYRFLAQGTMEEKIYDRQVTKLSLSIRVVDEQQIDRHFNATELAELYNFEPDSIPNRPTPMVPKDTLLAEMLIKHKDWIVAYHEHDSLLQNETEEDLTEEERKAAWAEYENEREGRYIAEENTFPVDDTLKSFCREPDFNEAIYEGKMISTAKSMIETIIATFRKMHPTSSAVDLRKKLQAAIYTLRASFQEKHVKTLRIKQEFVAKGSVPVAVNKYLEELNQIVADLSLHYDNVSAMVNKDIREAFQAQQAFQHQVNHMRANNTFIGNRPNINMTNQQHFTAQRFPHMGVRMNPAAAANFKAGNVRWNPAQAHAFSDLYRRLQQEQLAAQQQKAAATPEPVITETDASEPKQSEPTNNKHSSVQITEIE